MVSNFEMNKSIYSDDLIKEIEIVDNTNQQNKICEQPNADQQMDDEQILKAFTGN